MDQQHSPSQEAAQLRRDPGLDYKASYVTELVQGQAGLVPRVLRSLHCHSLDQMSHPVPCGPCEAQPRSTP